MDTVYVLCKYVVCTRAVATPCIYLIYYNITCVFKFFFFFFSSFKRDTSNFDQDIAFGKTIASSMNPDKLNK